MVWVGMGNISYLSIWADFNIQKVRTDCQGAQEMCLRQQRDGREAQKVRPFMHSETHTGAVSVVATAQPVPLDQSSLAVASRGLQQHEVWIRGQATWNMMDW